MSAQPEQTSEGIEIRPMQAADIAGVLRVEQETPGAPHWPLQAYESCVRASAEGLQRRAWIALQKGVLTGFIVASGLAADEAAEWELESLVVYPERQRGGVGGSLIATLLRELKMAGAAAILLEVRASNHAAVRLYQRAGLSVIGTRKGYYADPFGGDSEDALFMQLRFQ
jgi:[ribosomal protein S18]-alanine N-acetyltransferase